MRVRDRAQGREALTEAVMIHCGSMAGSDSFKCVVPSWAEITGLTSEVAAKIEKSGFYPDAIVAVSRGGLVPGRLVADFLHVKNVLAIKADHWGITASKDGKASISYGINPALDLSGQKILIVDDVTDTGESLELCRRHVLEKNPADVRTATVYHLSHSKYKPDYFGAEREWAWIVFPWNRTEDLVNIINKIRQGKEMPAGEIKAGLREFNLDLSEKEVLELLDHMRFLEGVARKAK